MKFQINNFKMSRREVQFRVLLDERMDLTYPNIGVLAFLTNFWLFHNHDTNNAVTNS